MNNKSVLITGGNRGIGLDITRCFVREGYKVYVAARNIYKLQDEFGERVVFIKTDVRDYDEVNKAVSRVIEENGKLDCLINNAGFSSWKPIEEIDDVFLSDIIDTNLKGFFWGCKSAAKVMESGASIINISSIAGKRGSANNSAYCATKFGVNGLTQSLAKELGPRNIRVNALCPVLIPTDGLLEALQGQYAPASGKDPFTFIENFAQSNAAFKRLPTGEEVGNMCLFLSSNKASAITGQCINVDCGVFPQ
jgi:NAD(P)-dependent dehydrogenase (short-subunit alcohol dehydrogenase family)